MKNKLIDMFQSCGYDLITSMEKANRYIQEFKLLVPGKYTYTIQNIEITFTKE